MKILAPLLLILSLQTQSQVSYYISNSGDDVTNNGLTPATAWRTIAKVNISTFNPGDTVKFERGGTWRETLTVPSSGVHFVAYGTGDIPKILGSTQITSWNTDPIGGEAANNDVMQESFEGTGYQNSWTESLGTNTGVTVDENSTDVTPVTGTEVLKIVKSTSPTATAAESKATAQRLWAINEPVAYMDFRVMITSHGLSSSGLITNLFSSLDGNANKNTILLLRNLSGDIKLFPQIYTADDYQGASYPASGSITLDHWYHVQIVYDITGMQYSVVIDGTTVMAGSITGTPRIGTNRIILGGSQYATAVTAYFDDVNVSTTNFESPAINLPANVWSSDGSVSDPYGLPYKGNTYFIKHDGSISWGRVKKDQIEDLSQEYDWTTSGGKLLIYSAADPNTQYAGVEVSQRLYCVNMNNKENLTFGSLEIAYSGSYGIGEQDPATNLDGLDITNCLIHHFGIKASLAGYGIETWHSNARIEYNTIHNSGRRNISLNIYNGNAQVHDIVVAHNKEYSAFHTTGVDMSSTGTGSLRYIFIHDNEWWNELSDSIDNVEYYGSGFIYAERDGTGYVGNIYIYNNLGRNVTSRAVALGGVGGPDSVYFFNNTIAGVSPHLTQAFSSFVLVQAGTNLRAKNNIFYSNVDIAKNTTFSHINVTEDAGTVLLDNNLYFNSTGSTRFIGWHGTSYSTDQLSTYRSATGQDLNSIVGQDPLLASTYKLKLGSPAIGSGVAGIDMGGSGFSSSDIGAFGVVKPKLLLLNGKFLKLGGKMVIDYR